MEQKPTIGRQVYFYPYGSNEPHAATVVHVWGDECVNLAIYDHNGISFSKTSVTKGAPEDTSKDRWAWPTRS